MPPGTKRIPIHLGPEDDIRVMLEQVMPVAYLVSALSDCKVGFDRVCDGDEDSRMRRL